jgi:hypothetical protein
MENNMDNIITIASENGKRKKGGGTNAILTLMKELGDFQEKVEVCIDAQDISDRREKLGIFYDKLDEIAEVLLEMASEGIKSKRKVDALEEIEEEEIEEEDSEIEDLKVEKVERSLKDRPQSSSTGSIKLLHAPSIPFLPR